MAMGFLLQNLEPARPRHALETGVGAVPKMLVQAPCVQVVSHIGARICQVSGLRWLVS